MAVIGRCGTGASHQAGREVRGVKDAAHDFSPALPRTRCLAYGVSGLSPAFGLLAPRPAPAAEKLGQRSGRGKEEGQPLTPRQNAEGLIEVLGSFHAPQASAREARLRTSLIQLLRHSKHRTV